MKKILISVGVIVILVFTVVFYLNLRSSTQLETLSSETPSFASSSFSATPTTSAPTINTSSSIPTSSIKVGPYAIEVSCHKVPETDFVSPDKIDIYKNGIIVQTISVSGDMLTCPKAEVRGTPQYVQTNGSPYYFILPVSFGTAGTNYQYWIFNTSTQQFYCPKSNGCAFNPGP